MAKISPMFALEAEELFENGNYQAAIELCKNGIELYPEYTTGYLTLIDLYIKISENDLANELISKVKELFPHIHQIYYYEKILQEKLNEQSLNDREFDSLEIPQLSEHLNEILSEKIITENDVFPDDIDNILDDLSSEISKYNTQPDKSTDEIQEISADNEYIQTDYNITSETKEYPTNEEIQKNKPQVENILETLPRGFLKYFAAKSNPELYQTSIQSSDKFIIDGLFDYVFFDYSKSNLNKIELNASFNIEYLASKYGYNKTKDDEITQLAEKITSINKITPIVEEDDLSEEEPIDFTPPATETMAKILTQQGKLDKAIEIYIKLAESHPEKRDYFLLQANQIKKTLNKNE